MMTHLRPILASCSVAIVTFVNVTAAVLGPDHGRLVLLVFVAVALGAAVQSAGWEPGNLTWALLCSVPPVTALLAAGSPSWLIGPLGALLLIGAELNVLGWEVHGAATGDAVIRRRLLNVLQLGGIGLAASLMIGVVDLLPSPGGTLALVTATTAFAALGWIVFARGT